MENTKIEWAHHTFNPWIGCSKVSPGCTNCYAENLMGKRFNKATWGPNGSRVKTSASNWKQPLKWNAEAEKLGFRYRVFCASLADVFEDRPELVEWRADLFDLIDATPNLDWLLLTKRPENIRRMLPYTDTELPLRNVWLGTSVENQEQADKRIPELLKVPAKIHFLSMEPLLGAVDLNSTLGGTLWIGGQRGCAGEHKGDGSSGCPKWKHHHHDVRCGKGIDWVIVGGESGPGARPIHPDWVRSLQKQCNETAVPFFFKQWGEWSLFYDRDRDDPDWANIPKLSRNTTRISITGGQGFHNKRVIYLKKVGKVKAGRLLDGREWNEAPEVGI